MQNSSTEVVEANLRPFVILDPRPLDARNKPFIASAERLNAISKGDSVKVLAVWLGTWGVFVFCGRVVAPCPRASKKKPGCPFCTAPDG